MTTTSPYYAPRGGLPGQTELTTNRAMFTEAYAVLPKGTMTDIVTSNLPFWDRTRLWVIARPLSGFAETFSQYIVEVSAGGGSDRPEADPAAEAVLFVVEGTLRLTIGDTPHELEPGGYAFLPPGAAWTLRNEGSEPARFHWIRKAYQRVEGIDVPEAEQVVNEYPIAVLADAPNPQAAAAFVELVRSEEGQQALAAAGFRVP